MVFFGEDRRPSIRPSVRPSIRTTNGYAGAHEGSGSDSSPERRDDSGADTGLEAPMWQLGLGGGGGESGPAYPERPGVADCLHYLRTGYCGYGAMCRFNHPRHRSTVVGATRTGGAEYPQRAGQPTHRLGFLERRMLFVRPPVRTMNGYPGAQEGSRSNPLPEWPNDPRAETGLEEPMWQLGSGSGSSGEGEPDLAHPERPGEAYCIYYLRTGYCWYGAMCRFNHPRLQNTVVGARRAGGAEYPERAGQRICLYYMKTGRCKFGAACRYHHPRHGAGPSEYSLPTRSSSTASMSVTSVGSARASSGPAPSQMPDLSSTNPASRNTEERHSPG